MKTMKMKLLPIVAAASVGIWAADAAAAENTNATSSGTNLTTGFTITNTATFSVIAPQSFTQTKTLNIPDLNSAATAGSLTIGEVLSCAVFGGVTAVTAADLTTPAQCQAANYTILGGAGAAITIFPFACNDADTAATLRVKTSGGSTITADAGTDPVCTSMDGQLGMDLTLAAETLAPNPATSGTTTALDSSGAGGFAVGATLTVPIQGQTKGTAHATYIVGATY